MVFKCLLLFSVVLIVNSASYDSEDYMDSVIGMLLYGDEVSYDEDVNNEAEPTLIGGIWQCGDCDVITDDSLIYSEHNTVDNNLNDLPFEIQIGVAAPRMRCVTVSVSAAHSSAVRRVTGACGDGAVTLSVTPPQDFVVKAYS